MSAAPLCGFINRGKVLVKRLLLAIPLLFPALMLAQTDNTVYVKNFAGATVGQKTIAAQASCNPAIVCVVVLDPSLSKWTTGTMPLPCTECLWEDFRTTQGGIQISGGVVGQTGWLPGGLLDAKSSVCGAVGDGVHSDTAALNDCWAYAVAHGMSIHIPAGTYVVDGCGLNFTVINGSYAPGISIWGDGPTKSVFAAKLTAGTSCPTPAIMDFGGDGAGALHGVGIGVIAGDQDAAGVIVSTGGQSGDYGNNFLISESTITAGTGSSGSPGCAVLMLGADLSVIEKSFMTGQNGSGFIGGDTQGDCITGSSWYALGLDGDATTKISISHSIIEGTNDTAQQLTGSAEYNETDIYSAVLGSATGTLASNGNLVIGHTGGTEGNDLFFWDVRFENQSQKTGVNCYELLTIIHNGELTGTCNTDSSGAAFGGAGFYENLIVNIDTVNNLFAMTGSLVDSVVMLGVNSSASFGYICSNWSGTTCPTSGSTNNVTGDTIYTNFTNSPAGFWSDLPAGGRVYNTKLCAQGTCQDNGARFTSADGSNSYSWLNHAGNGNYGFLGTHGLSWDSGANASGYGITSSQRVLTSCGTVSFSSGATSTTATCSAIVLNSSTSICEAFPTTAISGLSNVYYTISGSNVTLFSATSGTGTYALACSTN
jgi:hypothetical protein